MFLNEPIKQLNENDIFEAMKTAFEYDLNLLTYNLTSSAELPLLGKKLLKMIDVKASALNKITIKTINETDVVKSKLTDIVEQGKPVVVKCLSKSANAGPTTDIHPSSEIFPSYARMIKSCKEHRIDVGFYDEFKDMQLRDSKFLSIYRSNIFNNKKPELNNKKISYSDYRARCKKAFIIEDVSYITLQITDKYDLSSVSSSRIYNDFSNINSFIKLIRECITSICQKPKMNIKKLPQGEGPLSFAQKYITSIFMIFNNMLDDVLFMFFKKLDAISKLNKQNIKDNTI